MLEYNSLTSLAIIYIISGLMLLSVGPFLQLPYIRGISKFCFKKCPTAFWNNIKKLRGNNYYLNIKERLNKKKNHLEDDCLFTVWAFSHLILYIIIGFYAPQRFWEALVIGILFEFFEKFAFDCHDVLDIIWNTTGFLIGSYLHRLNTFS